MKILGIDPALSITGYGLISLNKKNIALLEAGIIQTSSGQLTPQRLDKIYQGILSLINDTKPDCLVLEKIYSHYRHPVTAFILGQARGVICLACAQKDIPLIEYAATRVKKAIVGKGLASKYQVKMMVGNILGLNESSLPRNSDVTDALALAIAHSYIMRTRR